jgi:hypothetical protein
MKTLASLKADLERKTARVKALEERVGAAKKKLNLKKREQRNSLRYSAGGIVLDPKFYNKYDGLLQDLYDNSSTRDKKKYVEAGLIQGDINKLSAINISECKESAKAAGMKDNLTKEERIQLQDALEKNVYQKVYGRKGEIYVYTGPNEKLYISDNVSKYLLENEDFTV